MLKWLEKRKKQMGLFSTTRYRRSNSQHCSYFFLLQSYLYILGYILMFWITILLILKITFKNTNISLLHLYYCFLKLKWQNVQKERAGMKRSEKYSTSVASFLSVFILCTLFLNNHVISWKVHSIQSSLPIYFKSSFQLPSNGLWDDGKEAVRHPSTAPECAQLRFPSARNIFFNEYWFLWVALAGNALAGK